MTLTNRHQGKRFLVCGTGPGGHILKRETWQDAIVIGINNFPTLSLPPGFPIHYWLTCDTHRIAERMPNALPALTENWPQAEIFFNSHVNGISPDLPEPTHWFDRPDFCLNRDGTLIPDYPIPTTWEGRLQHWATSATAGGNAADIMGASEIILWRVDLIGDTSFGAEMVPWSMFAPAVSDFFNRLRCTVYKTSQKSPLDLPLWPS